MPSSRTTKNRCTVLVARPLPARTAPWAGPPACRRGSSDRPGRSRRTSRSPPSRRRRAGRRRGDLHASRGSGRPCPAPRAVRWRPSGPRHRRRRAGRAEQASAQADVDAAGRPSSTRSTRGAVASHFASTTFCWLPPDRVETGLPRPADFTYRRLVQVSASARSAARRSRPNRLSRQRRASVALRSTERSMTRPCWRRSSGTRARPAATPRRDCLA